MNNRKKYLTKLDDKIGRRDIVWFGVRGDDASSLLALSQFNTCYSFTAPLQDGYLKNQVCLEKLTGQRVDLNWYDAGDDKSQEFDFLYRNFLDSCMKPSVLACYSSWPIITAAKFTRIDTVQFLGLLHDQRNRFENRAWVETELRQANIPVVPWMYLSNYDSKLIKNALKQGPQILRSNRSSGGTGFILIREEEDVPDISNSDNRIFAISPFLYPNIPLNINGCIFPSGDITLHGPSLQLVGISSCTSKQFGYCGNDFARIKDIEQNILLEMEAIVFRVAQWLHKNGYIGAFGLDMILYDGKLYVSEINPRFQGSSKITAILDQGMELTDIFIAHLSSFLGLDAPEYVPIKNLVNNQMGISQIYCSNEFGGRAKFNGNYPNTPISTELQLVPSKDVSVEKGGVLYRVIIPETVTEDGLSLVTDIENKIKTFTETFSRE